MVNKKDVTRRSLIGGIGGGAIVALAGCSSKATDAVPLMGPRFDEKDLEEISLDPEFFGPKWVYAEDETKSDSDDIGLNANSTNESGNESDSSVIEQLNFDPKDYPGISSVYKASEDDWPTGFAFAYVGILEDGDMAKDAVTAFGERVFVNSKDSDVGDTAVRGEAESTGLMLAHLANAFVMTGAISIDGFNISPDNLTALEACEELVSQLKEL